MGNRYNNDMPTQKAVKAHIEDKTIHPRVDRSIIGGLCHLIVDALHNVYGGLSAFYSKTIGSYNTMLGDSVGYNMTEGQHNVAIGASAFYNNVDGDRNTIIGDSAGYGVLLKNNTAVGASSLYSADTVEYATVIGHSSAYSLKVSQGGVYVGYSAGYNIEDDSANPNTIIGNQAGSFLKGVSHGNIILGANAGPGCVQEAKVNQGWIDNRQTDRSILKLELGDPDDDNDTRRLTVHGDTVIAGNLITYENDIRKFTSLLVHANSDFSDSSPNNYTPTVVGATIDTSDKKLGAGSGFFEAANGDAVHYPKEAGISGLADWTIEAWFYLESYDAGWRYIFNQDQAGGLDTDYLFEFAIEGTTSNQSFQFEVRNDGDTRLMSYDDITINLNTWYHILITRHCGLFYLYLDGIKQTYDGSGAFEAITSDFEFPALSGEFYVGGCDPTGRSITPPEVFFDGNIDEIRISKGIMWHSEDFLVQLKEFGA